MHAALDGHRVVTERHRLERSLKLERLARVVDRLEEPLLHEQLHPPHGQLPERLQRQVVPGAVHVRMAPEKGKDLVPKLPEGAW